MFDADMILVVFFAVVLLGGAGFVAWVFRPNMELL